MSTNQQPDGGKPDWLPEYVDEVTAFAELPAADDYEMARVGGDALWYAACFHEPQLITPAQTLLDRSTTDEARLWDDTESYLGARLARAFVGAHKEWAEDKNLSPETVRTTHTLLAELIGITASPRSDSEYRTQLDYMARTTFMGLLTRTDDPSVIVFPAPPVIQFDETGAYTPHSDFLSIEGALHPCDIELTKPPQLPRTPGLINIFPGEALVAGVQKELPHIHARFAHEQPSRKRKERAVRHVAALLVQEVNGTIDETAKTFLDNSSGLTHQFLRGKAERVPRA